jgi:hypothetical protein
VAQQVFKQDFEGIRQSVYVTFFYSVKAINLKFIAIDLKRSACAKAVRHVVSPEFGLYKAARRPQGVAL